MKRKLMAFIQLAFGVALVILLLHGIDRNSLLAEFTVPPSSIDKGAIYVHDVPKAPGQHLQMPQFIVLDSVQNGTTVRCLHMGKDAENLPSSGTLKRTSGTGPDTLDWTARQVNRYGFKLLSGTFRLAGRNWPALSLGAGLFGLCLLLCIVRWNLLLQAQKLHLPLRQVVSIFFVGQFFNSFMPGAVGGDLIKAYFAAKQTHHQKTEAVSTVVIDRIIGLLALVGITAVVMAVFFRFFLSHKATQVALIFNAGLLAFSVLFLVVVFRKNLFERWDFFKRLEQRTSLGRITSRVYRAFRICLSHPGLLFKTSVLSVINHLVFILCACFLGKALEIPLSFLDYLIVFPVINAVAAIPVTPGGLGTRDGMAIFLLGVLNVPATSAITLSLLLYASVLAWSLVGGVVYAFYIYSFGSGIRREIDMLIEQEDADSDKDDTPAPPAAKP